MTAIWGRVTPARPGIGDDAGEQQRECRGGGAEHGFPGVVHQPVASEQVLRVTKGDVGVIDDARAG